MLTLAAMHVLNDSSDPFFTSLQAGAYDKVRPSGQPCDAVFSCGGPRLGRGGKIALAVVLSVVGSMLMAGIALYIYRNFHGGRKSG